MKRVSAYSPSPKIVAGYGGIKEKMDSMKAGLWIVQRCATIGLGTRKWFELHGFDTLIWGWGREPPIFNFREDLHTTRPFWGVPARYFIGVAEE